MLSSHPPWCWMVRPPSSGLPLSSHMRAFVGWCVRSWGLVSIADLPARLSRVFLIVSLCWRVCLLLKASSPLSLPCLPACLSAFFSQLLTACLPSCSPMSCHASASRALPPVSLSLSPSLVSPACLPSTLLDGVSAFLRPCLPCLPACFPACLPACLPSCLRSCFPLLDGVFAPEALSPLQISQLVSRVFSLLCPFVGGWVLDSSVWFQTLAPPLVVSFIVFPRLALRQSKEAEQKTWIGFWHLL